MDDTGGQPANSREFFSARDCTFGFNARRYVFADGDHVRNLIAIISAHWNFANQPVIGLAVVSDCLLFDSMDFAGRKNFAEFTLKQFTTLLGKNFKDVSTERLAARQTQLAQFSITIPGNYSIIAIDRVK